MSNLLIQICAPVPENVILTIPDKDKALHDLLFADTKAAINLMYDKYAGALYGYILRILHSDEVASHLLTDVFSYVASHKKNWATGSCYTWLMQITRNLCCGKNPEPKPVLNNSIQTAVTPGDIFELAWYRGMNLHEIAEQTGLDRPAVQKALRQHFHTLKTVAG